MSNVIHLGVKKFKRMSYEEVESLLDTAKKKVKEAQLQKKVKLLSLNLKTINEHRDGVTVFVGVKDDGGDEFNFMNPTPLIYVWADNEEKAREQALLNGITDRFSFFEVNEKGELDEFLF
jgi:uncharacterized protein (DUF2344 family)